MDEVWLCLLGSGRLLGGVLMLGMCRGFPQTLVYIVIVWLKTTHVASVSAARWAGESQLAGLPRTMPQYVEVPWWWEPSCRLRRQRSGW